ncbi:MAG: hypothetical protein AAFU77_00930 [Myxococcota bacterium]
MSDIKNTSSTAASTLANIEAQQAQAKAEQEAIAIQVATRSRTVTAVGATKEAETAAAVLATTTAIPEPSLPSVDLDSAAVSGAESFAGNLNYVGAATDDSNVLLSRFLKLQVLTETNDKWSQVMARQAQSLLMLGALEMSRSTVGAEADAEFAKAAQLQDQALALAAPYMIGENGRLDGFFGNSGDRDVQNLLRRPQVTFNEEGFTAHDGANPNLVGAIESYAEAEALESSGQPGADAAYAASDAALNAYMNDPSKVGDVVEVDGKLYDIGSMDKATINQIVATLAAAEYHYQRGNDLKAAQAQGIGASQLRKGQQLLDSMKRLEGHDQYLAAVMRTMSGTEAQDEKLSALRVVEEQRQTVAALVEAGASNASDFQKNKIQPFSA